MIWNAGLMRFTAFKIMDEMSRKSKRIAVLGMDSFIGSYIFKSLRQAGFDCWGTTRRATSLINGSWHLDLLDECSWQTLIDSKPDIAIACFAISKLDECENDPTSFEINAVRIPALLNRLAQNGCRPVLLSTNSVFGGERPLCQETDVVAPDLAYSRQKHAAELQVSALRTSHAIVRITRTISADLPPFDGWLRNLRNGKDIEAFDDFIFAPMTRAFVFAGLLDIALSPHDGLFHLSGADVSYHELAQQLAASLGWPAAVIRTNSVTKGVSLRFRPRYSALGMQRTSQLLSLQPQPVTAVVAHLVQAST